MTRQKINYKGLENYLKITSQKNIFINKDQIFTKNDIKKFRSLMEKYGKTVFYSTLGNGDGKFLVEIDCSFIFHVEEKGKPKKIIGFSRKNFINYLRLDNKEFYCDVCQEIDDFCKEQQQEKIKQQNFGMIISNTTDYIENYLDPKNTWNKEVNGYERFSLISTGHVDWHDIAKEIKSMNYKDFLNTPFWKAVASHCKYKGKYKCHICNGSKQLETHHKTYENHGYEQFNLKDLVTLCNECHSKFHDKFPERSD